MLYPILLGLHGYGMCLALLLFVASELLLAIARRGHAMSARAALHLSRCAGIVVPIGVLAGIALFFAGGWPLTAWLIASLVLVALLIVVERRFVRPWKMQAHPLLKGTASSDDVRALVRDTPALLGRMAMMGLFGLIVLLMIVKPPLDL
ncbi:MAG TPA: hypothetical protein VFF96_04860 [Pseudoxanthomonas sp.]|nr:hypothetical protein [Pseudoxanthomonas sp.]